MTDQQANLPGARLRAERERQNLSEQEVAARLHLSMSYLKALEADDYTRLPEPPFVKGYVRNYARLLGLPATELVQDFETLVQDRGDDKLISPVHMVMRERGPGWLWPAVIIAVAVVIALGWWGTRNMGPADELLPVLSAPQTMPPAAPDSGNETAPPQEPMNVEAPTEALPEDSGTEVIVPPAPVADGPTELAMNEPAPLDVLQVTFGGDCWVQVTDATGEEIYQGQQRSGGQLALDGEAPFRVTLGNAAAVTSLQFNGETQNLPTAAPGRVIRITVP